MLALPHDLLSTVRHTIDEFRLFSDHRRVLSAFSGGKDSTITTIALRELGYEVVPTAVDMGYTEGWSSRVAAIGAATGTRLNIVDIRDAHFQSSLSDGKRNELNARLHELDTLDLVAAPNSTPCTQCYNSKVTALEVAASHDAAEWIAFGHHATDAIASLLKSGLMYIDRWDRGHETYERETFAALVDELRDEMGRDLMRSRLVARIGKLVALGLTSTDEPPIQPLIHGQPTPRVARPLFDVFEHDILAVQATNQIDTESSGCSHGLSSVTETPREMVHFRVLRLLAESPDGRQALLMMRHLVRQGLKSDGTLVVDARRERARLLGPNYRASNCSNKL